jgi:hypothetical protein
MVVLLFRLGQEFVGLPANLLSGFFTAFRRVQDADHRTDQTSNNQTSDKITVLAHGMTSLCLSYVKQSIICAHVT